MQIDLPSFKLDRYPRTWVEVNLESLGHNLGLFREQIGPNVLLALVVKADAYGHGLVPVSAYALSHGADWVAVATVQEGVTLRQAGIESPIVVISPVLPFEAEEAVYYRLRVLVERTDTARAISEAASQIGIPAIVHLEIDTGLARFGAVPGDALAIAKEISLLPNIIFEGMSTHFADSSSDIDGTYQQIESFDSCVELCQTNGISPKILHVANSTGAVRYPVSRKALVRTGIGAYGIDPYNLFEGKQRPVMTWKARAMAIRTLGADSPVSYSGIYRTKGRETIVTLGVGYGDGYPRSLSDTGFATIRGHRVPVVGRVCMDQVLVNATNVPNLQLGEVAVIAGGDVPIPELAKLAGTNPHEIVCRLMPRVPRHYLFPA